MKVIDHYTMNGPSVTIDLNALRHNVQIARQLAPKAQLMAVIKADAYGHGLLPVARALSDVDLLAVARISEAKQLYDAGIEQPILILEGCFDQEEMLLASECGFSIVVHHESQITLLEQMDHLPNSMSVWLKIDTGMHRLGIQSDRVDSSFQRLSSLSVVQGQPKLLTHFANADDIDNQSTVKQIQQFIHLTESFKSEYSLANSAAIFAWPESHFDWVRPGIMLYGASPLLGKTADDHHLKPVMTFCSELLAVNDYQAGDCIGYGSQWCCPEAMSVGVVAVGYGDGYPRHAPSGTAVLINGQRSQILGRVSMDMLTIDLRNIDAQPGDQVILWGEGLPVEEIAQSAGTISYELLCGITSRVKHRVIHE